MNNLAECLIEVPNGVLPALQELHSLGLGKYLNYDVNGNPVSIKLDRYYSPVNSPFEPTIVHLLANYEEAAEILFNGEEELREFQNIKVLAFSLADNQTIWGILLLSPVNLEIYMGYVHYEDYLEDGSHNPQVFDLITLEDGESYWQLKPIEERLIRHHWSL